MSIPQPVQEKISPATTKNRRFIKVPLVIFVLIVAASLVFIFNFFSSSIVPGAIQTSDSQEISEPIIIQDEPINPDWPEYWGYYRYIYGDAILWYEQPGSRYEWTKHTLYLTEGSNTTEITNEVASGMFGEYVPPYFKRTSDPNIPLLIAGEGHYGFGNREHYYIHLEQKSFFKVLVGHFLALSVIEIKTFQDENFKISILINDNCGKTQDIRSHGMKGILTDLALDDQPQGAIDPPRELVCVSTEHEDFLEYEEVIYFVFEGVDKDFSKIYFSLIIGRWDEDDSFWQEHFSLDLNARTIQPEKPIDLL